MTDERTEPLTHCSLCMRRLTPEEYSRHECEGRAAQPTRQPDEKRLREALRVAFAREEDDRPDNSDGGDFGRGHRAGWNSARGIVLAALAQPASEPVGSGEPRRYDLVPSSINGIWRMAEVENGPFIRYEGSGEPYPWMDVDDAIDNLLEYEAEHPQTGGVGTRIAALRVVMKAARRRNAGPRMEQEGGPTR